MFVKSCFMSLFGFFVKQTFLVGGRGHPPRWGRDSTAPVLCSTLQPSSPLLLSETEME